MQLSGSQKEDIPLEPILEPIFMRQNDTPNDIPNFDMVLSERVCMKLKKVIPEETFRLLGNVHDFLKKQAELDAIEDITLIGIRPAMYPDKLRIKYDRLLCFNKSLELAEKIGETMSYHVCDFHKNEYEKACEEHFLTYCPPYKLRVLEKFGDEKFGDIVQVDKIAVEQKKKFQKKCLTISFKSGVKKQISYYRYRGRSPKKFEWFLRENGISGDTLKTEIIYDGKKVFGDFQERFVDECLKSYYLNRIRLPLQNIKTKKGNNILMCLCMNDRINSITVEQAKQLVNDFTFDINTTNIYLQTPIMLACLFGHGYYASDMLDFLLDSGANVIAKDFNGKSISDYDWRSDVFVWLKIMKKRIEQSTNS